MITYDVIIIGSGIAALQLARNLKKDLNVIIITKSKKHHSNSYRAQGGIAAAVGKDDHYSIHYQDTLEAGGFFQHEKAVHELVVQGPLLIHDLQQAGFRFDTTIEGELSLGMEGAHSRRRILHSGGDETGKQLMDHMIAQLPSQIKMIEDAFVYELLLDSINNYCIGVKVMTANGQICQYIGDAIVLATGGIGGLYSFTSNDSTVTGDGIALAYHAGAVLKDMEFIQFHPTLIYREGKTHGLISEAVRGEGAVLIDGNGKKVMENIHPLKELAPRHVVAKEIYEQRLKGKEVYLDISSIASFASKFPTITKLCEQQNISLSTNKIPVAPGCHFLMGGIAVNEVGETSVKRLFALGETAASGIHGANRLASNSLLEGLFAGKKLAAYLNEHAYSPRMAINRTTNIAVQHKTWLLPKKEEIQARMMQAAGIVRSHTELVQLQLWLQQYMPNSDERVDLDRMSVNEIQTFFMLTTALLITNAALFRQESRGAHIRKDFPYPSKEWEKLHVIQTKALLERGRNKNEYLQVKIDA